MLTTAEEQMRQLPESVRIGLRTLRNVLATINGQFEDLQAQHAACKANHDAFAAENHALHLDNMHVECRLADIRNRANADSAQHHRVLQLANEQHEQHEQLVADD